MSIKNAFTKKLSSLFIFFVISIIGTYLYCTTQPQQQPLDGELTLEWRTYIPTTSLPGFLYIFRKDEFDFLLSTDEPISDKLLPDKLQFATSSNFFNPNACAKMPNIFWKDYVLFRSYSASNSEPHDLIYAYNINSREITETTPPFKIVGDLYTYNEILYFFFIQKDKLYIAYTKDSLTHFETRMLDEVFDHEKMRFYAGEPAFSYQTKSLDKYVFNFNAKKFVHDNDYMKPQRIKSEGSNLVFLFPGTSFRFIDEKRFEGRKQELQYDDTILYTYTGSGNIYPIGAISKN
jgi:hypothetical protein